MRIREAYLSDVMDIYRATAHQFMEYSKLQEFGLTVDAEAICALAESLVSGDGGTVLVAVNDDGKIAGSIGLIKCPWYMNPAQTVVSELWFWVSPEHRGTKAAIKLIEAAEEYAIKAGAECMSLIMLSDTELRPRVERLYKFMGYNKLEEHYLRRL